MDAMRPTLVDAEAKTSALGKAWDYVKTAASGAYDALGRAVSRAVNGPEISQATLDALNRQIEQARNSPLFRGLDPQSQAMSLQALETQRDAVMIALDTARRTADADAREMEQRATSLAAQNIIRQFIPDQADLEQLEKFKTTLEQALAAPNAPGGLDVVLQRIRERLQAGGTQAEQFGRASRDAFALSGLTGYARELETIRQKYAELIETASRSGNLAAVGTLVMAQGTDIQAVNDNLLRTPSSYRKGVADVPEQYRAALLAAAARYNVDPNLGASVLWQESRFNPDIINGRIRSRAGAAGIAQFMPDTAAQYGIDPLDPQQAIPAMMRMLSERLQARNGNVPLALADYNFGAGNVNRVGGDVSRFPAETRNYIAEITRQTPATQAQVEMVRSWEQATKNSTQSLELHRGALSMTTFEIEKSKQARQLENEAIQRGEELTDGLRAKIDAEATARARNAAAIQQTNAERFIEQQRRELGMTSTDLMVERQMRSLGVGKNDPQREFVESNLRMNAALAETRSLASESLRGFLSDLRSGASLMDALGNMANRLADRLISMAADRAIAALFNGFGGGGTGTGGGLMGFFSSLFGGSAVPARANGGWISGPGSGTSDSILARLSNGEFVVNANSAARHRQVLEAINGDRLPRFAAGGFALTGSGVPAIGPAGAPQQPVVYVENYSGAGVRSEAVSDGPKGPGLKIIVGEMIQGMISEGQLDRPFRARYGMNSMRGA
ncbi:lytic transglycosylase domain-containing protein [Enterovirga sp. CN4-39]|uniref:lytic transglycosylase domain-containing protein n=1 Tax=Enterovirga sp. CN4-39 TaxID=3400910 RepID=UPI003C08E982